MKNEPAADVTPQSRIDAFDALSLAHGQPFDALSLAHGQPFDALSLAHGQRRMG
jgi:hypothetical protein